MKNIKIYEKVNGLKRWFNKDDFVNIPRPLEAANFPEISVKIFTDNIYIPEIGSYIVVVWDFQQQKPAILLLSHTLFSALKRWRSDTMQDIIGKTFIIVSKTNNNVVYHDIYCKGVFPLLIDEIINDMDDYINDLFDISILESEE